MSTNKNIEDYTIEELDIILQKKKDQERLIKDKDALKKGEKLLTFLTGEPYIKETINSTIIYYEVDESLPIIDKTNRRNNGLVYKGIGFKREVRFYFKRTELFDSRLDIGFETTIKHVDKNKNKTDDMDSFYKVWNNTDLPNLKAVSKEEFDKALSISENILNIGEQFKNEIKNL